MFLLRNHQWKIKKTHKTFIEIEYKYLRKFNATTTKNRNTVKIERNKNKNTTKNI